MPFVYDDEIALPIQTTTEALSLFTTSRHISCIKPRSSALAIALAAFTTLAPSLSAAAIATIVKSEIKYEIKPDLTYSYEESDQIRINEQQGVTQFGQMPLSYSESLQTLDVLEAYTVTKDGKRIDVTPDKILLQQLPASADAPTFSDHKIKAVVFPQVEVGAVIHLRYRKNQIKPELPGVLSLRESFSKVLEFQNAQLTVIAPANMDLQVESQGVDGGALSTSRVAGSKEWRWTIKNTSAIVPEPGMVSPDDFSPYVSVSNLKSYDDLAQAYLRGASKAAKVTPSVQKLADQLTKGISSKRAQAEAIYNWVSSKIRYVAIFMDVGGYVPHDADAILQAGYGDCKDHATILEALLAAKGIKSSQVLINAGHRFQQDKLATLAAFNHAITYLPEEKIFLDSTPSFAQFGVLPDSDIGKMALVINANSDHSTLIPTPNVDSKVDNLSVKTIAKINPDGTLNGQETIQSRGVFDVINRTILNSFPKEQVPQVVTAILAQRGQNGAGTMEFDDPYDLSKAFDYKVGYSLPNRVQLPGPGAFPTTVGIGSLVGIASFANQGGLPEHKLAFVCQGGRREETTQFVLPDSVIPTTLPKNVSVASKFGSYESSYRQQNGTITITRILDLTYPTSVCSGEDYLEIKKLANTVGQDLRAQILFQ